MVNDHIYAEYMTDPSTRVSDPYGHPNNHRAMASTTWSKTQRGGGQPQLPL